MRHPMDTPFWRELLTQPYLTGAAGTTWWVWKCIAIICLAQEYQELLERDER